MTTGIVYSRGVLLPDDEDAFAVGVDALLPRTAEPMLYDWEMAVRAKNDVATASMPVRGRIQDYVSRFIHINMLHSGMLEKGMVIHQSFMLQS